jgi:hypothetical protein
MKIVEIRTKYCEYTDDCPKCGQTLFFYDEDYNDGFHDGFVACFVCNDCNIEYQREVFIKLEPGPPEIFEHEL